MKIDNRILLPFVCPFALLIVARTYWLISGATWDAELGGPLCFVVGGLVGTISSFVLWVTEQKIGHTVIGWKKP